MRILKERYASERHAFRRDQLSETGILVSLREVDTDLFDFVFRKHLVQNANAYLVSIVDDSTVFIGQLVRGISDFQFFISDPWGFGYDLVGVTASASPVTQRPLRGSIRKDSRRPSPPRKSEIKNQKSKINKKRPCSGMAAMWDTAGPEQG
jgi:hypothetical protein